MNVSAYVPVGATGVIVQWSNAFPSSGNDEDFGVRVKGSTDPFTTEAAKDVHQGWLMTGLDANRVFQVYRGVSQIRVHTMNCLNGYFVAPAFDSLAESLVKPEGRGAIAAFSPSGLSLDAPVHEYHRALLAELTGGRHVRLGDALLAAQTAYGRTGLMPELLSIYHLFGDPAMVLR